MTDSTYTPRRADELEAGDVVNGITGPMTVTEAWAMNNGTIEVHYGSVTESYDDGYVLSLATPSPDRPALEQRTTYVTKCSGCGCPLHSSTTTGFCSATCEREASHLAQARYLGADAALTEVASIIMGEGDAHGTLTGDTHDDTAMTLADWAVTSVSEWEDACDQTLASMLDILVTTDDHVGAWEQGWDLVWEIGLKANAHRTLGDVVNALALEAVNERTIDTLRSAAGL